jgi:hypothetical protein
MVRTWKPVVAGILAIVGGFSTAGWLLGVYVLVAIFSSLGDRPFNPSSALGLLGLAVVCVLLALPVLAVAGGISAIQRKRWSLALAGSITSCFNPLWFLGIAAIIFTVLSAEEFE